MRAAVITEFNKPWELKQVADPKPGPGQVLIGIEACGMCGTDLHVHHGVMPLTPPIIAGHEPVGKIVELGAGVHGLQIGDRVGVSWLQKGCGRCRFCQEKRAVYCAEQQTWMHVGGGNADLMIAWAEGCTLVPSGVRPEDAAPVFCAGFTVFSGLRNASPRPGERVAVLGVGGLGHLALQYAKALGLETIAMTASPDKKKELTEMGADHVVVTGSDGGKALLEIGGADIVLSTTNSPEQVAQAFSGMRPEGRLVNMGLTQGPIVIGDLMGLILQQKRILGSTQNHRRDLVEALDLVSRGKVRPKVEVYPLDRVNEVRDRLQAGKVRYRAVFVRK